MSEPFQPTITRYYLSGVRVPKGTPGARKRREKSPTWWGSWQDPVSGKRVRKPLADTYKEAKELLEDIRCRNRRIAVGEAPALAPESSRALLESLDDHIKYLRAKKNLPKYCDNVRKRIARLLKILDWRTVQDVRKAGVLEAAAQLREGKVIELPAHRIEFTTAEVATLLGIQQASVREKARRLEMPDGVKDGHTYLYPRATVEALVARKRRGLSIASSNLFLSALKGFTAWLQDTDRIARDPLRRFKMLNPELDRRHARRALSEEAFTRFVEFVADSERVQGLTGHERLMLYTLAASTGLRASELASLTPTSFNLAAEPYSVLVEARVAKNRRQSRQRLRPDVAELLRVFLQDRPGSAPVWPGNWWKCGAEMVRHDLRGAGIEYAEAEHYFDFHALRGQFATMLARRGVHPRVAQALLRHSNITLTMKHYTHIDNADLGAALDKLPPLPGVKPPSPDGDEK